MPKQPNIAGCRFIGYVTNGNVNNGEAVPLFEPIKPPKGLSINTLEGWKAAADRQNRRSFEIALGRPPKDEAEFQKWVDSLCP